METPSSELLEAYRRTKFIVDQPDGETIIRHGECNRDIDKMLSQYAVRSGTFITAHNPHSRRLSDSENRKRHRLLTDEIKEQGFSYLTGRGVCANKDWPAEESLFVVGTTRDQATALGKKFGQLAVVWVEMGRAAEIVSC